MKFINLAEQTRELGQTAAMLRTLQADIRQARAGEIAKPVRELAPATLLAHELAARSLRQLKVLSTSQYAAMAGGNQNLAELAEATTQISTAAMLCTLAIHQRTETVLYEDADETPTSSRRSLDTAAEHLEVSAATYTRLAQRLSRRLASAGERLEDIQLIHQASTNTTPPTTPPVAPPERSTGRVSRIRRSTP